jgi:DNA-binding response OmpR family regulator
VDDRRRILLVEDDERIGASLHRALESNGYDATWAANARNGEAAFTAALASEPFQLVLLDLGLPDADGLDVCRRLVAADPLVPIIVLTVRDAELDLVVGLDAGAIDYITKPFSLASVLARLRAQLRRADASVIPHDHLPDGPMTGVGICLDARTRQVWRDGIEILMRPKEFDLLARLLREPGTAVRRETLMTDVWDENWFGSTKTLDFHIAALRKKLDDNSAKSHITTIRGVGFRFENQAGKQAEE